MSTVRDLGLFGEALATVDEAALHNYSASAAFAAAAEHLSGASADEAIVVAAVIAAWAVTDLNSTVEIIDLAVWLVQMSAIAARRAA